MSCMRFGLFEVDLQRGEVRKQGLRIRLAEKSFRMLVLLLEKPGEIVTRDELRQRLWPSDTYVDFDRNLYTTLNRLRSALGDSADAPRFIETVTRKGYRFIAPIEKVSGANSAENQPAVKTAPPGLSRSVIRITAGLMAVSALLSLAIYWGRGLSDSPKASPAQKILLAVTPFRNLSGDPSQDYLCEGITAEVLTEMSHLPLDRLGVIAQTSVERYQSVEKKAADIGKELGVQYVLEGSVHEDAENFRVNVQLLRVQSGELVWAARFDRADHDALSFQRDLAHVIASSLSTRLLGSDLPVFERAATSNPEAYDAYLRGRYQRSKASVKSILGAVEHFQTAIQADPGYAAAYAALADCYVDLVFDGELPREEGARRARAAAGKSVELDPSLAEGYRVLGVTRLFLDWDFAGAGKAFQRALQLGPGSAEIQAWAADYYAVMGRFEEAIVAKKQAIELNPASFLVRADLGYLYFGAGRLDEAIQECHRALQLEPKFTPALHVLAEAYWAEGRHEQAREAARSFVVYRGATPEDLRIFDQVDSAGAMEIFRRWKLKEMEEAARQGRGTAPALRVVAQYASLGEVDTAFQWLERSYARREPFLVFLKSGPEFTNLRAEPRFAEFVRRVGFPTT